MADEVADKGLGKFARPLRSIMHVQTRMLDSIIQRLAGDDISRPQEWDADVLRITPLMIQAMGVSVHSIIKLTGKKDMSIRDAYGIARSVTELAVNSCFIAACGGDVARRADRHAMQKTYRDFHRQGPIGGIHFEVKRSVYPEIADIPGLREALDEFTGKNGREITTWTPLDISARITEVGSFNESAAIALSGAMMAVYRHSSEMLHGTYFSVVHFWRGDAAFLNTKVDFNSQWDLHFTSIFTATYASAQGVIELFGSMYDMPEMVKAQREMNRAVLALMERYEAGSTTTETTVQAV